MTETAFAPDSVKRACDEHDGSSDEDPGPSCYHLLIAHDGWRTLDGVEPLLLHAYEACADKLPEIAGREVSLLLSSDREVAELNGRYRGQQKPTNVLSFPAAGNHLAGVSSQELGPLGDVIIAYETVMREAAILQKPALFHLAHLSVHGLLHLAGFDHQSEEDAERMERMERDILASIAIPDPYPTTLEEELADAS